jgi:menaquinol-cytochrome c reductase iron-sulfur subunit
LEPSHDHPHVPGPSLWPVGLAIGATVLLVGFVISWTIVVVGAIITIVFLFLWLRDLLRGAPELKEEAPKVEPERREKGPPRPTAAVPRAARPATAPAEGEKMPRKVFLEVATLGLGGVIGVLVAAPVLGFTIGPAFVKQGVKHIDLGPIEDYPEGIFQVTTFNSSTTEGFVSRRTAYIRNNGFLGKLPSFTIISNHCAHLGCPVQPNGQVEYAKTTHFKDVTKIPVNPSGFGCPCHGGQYDTEGNRTAGPPVRGLDRYSFSIVNGHLFVGKPFSVAYVTGTGAEAEIHAAVLHFPGEQVRGLESWMYPIQPPH